MTKAGFLKKLEEGLRDLSAEERERAVSYFAEQIDDCIEEGMTEGEAVDSLGRLEEIFAQVREQSGQAAAETKSEQGKSNRPEAKSFSTEQRPHIIRLTEQNNAVEILPSADGKIRIEYDVSRWIRAEISCDEGVLIYRAEEIFHVFHFDFVSRRPTRLYLPGEYLPELEIKTSNAKLTADHISCATANLKTSNAALTLSHITATEKLEAVTANGALYFAHISAKACGGKTSNAVLKAEHMTVETVLGLHTSNGSICAEHMTVDTLSGVTANAKICVEHVTAQTNLSLKSCNGHIVLRDSTAENYVFRTSNGSISASLPGSIADYRITSSGGTKSTLPTHKGSGERSLSAVTSNGKIDVIFADDR